MTYHQILNKTPIEVELLVATIDSVLDNVGVAWRGASAPRSQA
jgi:hypothetical protein